MSPEAESGPRKRTSSRKTASTKRSVSSRAKRKAPTPARSSSRQSSIPIKLIVVLFLSFVIVSALSVFIGTRDAGVINVSATMSERAALEASKGNTELSESIRSSGNSQSRSKEDDGLVGAGNKITEQQKQDKKINENKVPGDISTSTASSINATSTDDVSDSIDEEGGESSDEADASDTSDSSDKDSDGKSTDEQSDETEEIPEEDVSSETRQDDS